VRLQRGRSGGIHKGGAAICMNSVVGDETLVGLNAT
jgi:hypothetical protein